MAAIATPARAATWASTSLPRGVPAAVTTTEPAACRARTGPRSPRRRPRRPSNAVAGGVVHVAHAVRRELLDERVGPARHVADHDRVDRARRRRPRTRSRANVIASRETSIAPDASVSTRTRIIGPAPPAARSRSTTAGAAVGALAEHLHVAGLRRRQQQPDPLRSDRLGGGRALLDRHLLGLHPAGHGRVARLDAALEDRHDGGQRHRGRSRAPSGPVAARRRPCRPRRSTRGRRR